MRTILARNIGVAGFGQQVKAGDRAEALLGALDDVVQLWVDKVRDGVARALQAARSQQPWIGLDAELTALQRRGM